MTEQTPAPALGSLVPEFELQTPFGDSHSTSSLMGENGLLIAFICNHCPYVAGIADMLADDLHAVERMGIGTACIMSNDWEAYPADAPDRMKTFAAKHGLTCPYLIDADQSVARDFGAVCTPEFFGFNADGELQYRGRIDDKGRDGPEGRVPELVNAMKLIAETGKGPDEQTPSIGCSIKWR